MQPDSPFATQRQQLLSLRTRSGRARWLVAATWLVAALAATAIVLDPLGVQLGIAFATGTLVTLWPRIGTLVTLAAPALVLAVTVGLGTPLREDYWSTIAAAVLALLTAAAAARLARLLSEWDEAASDWLNRAQEKSIRDAVEEALAGGRRKNYVERELARAQRYQREMSVAVAEIDNLHLLRAQQGDVAAREALVELGNLFTTDTRLPDGGIGDELSLVFVLPETPLLGGRIVAERVRLAFHRMQLPGADGVTMTMSAGVANYPDDGQRSSDLLDAARVALRRAQEAGGNRTVISRPVPGAPPGWSGLQ